MWSLLPHFQLKLRGLSLREVSQHNKALMPMKLAYIGRKWHYAHTFLGNRRPPGFKVLRDWLTLLFGGNAVGYVL